MVPNRALARGASQVALQKRARYGSLLVDLPFGPRLCTLLLASFMYPAMTTLERYQLNAPPTLSTATHASAWGLLEIHAPLGSWEAGFVFGPRALLAQPHCH